MDASEDITRLLADCASGDPVAIERLLPLMYRELRAVAGALMKAERADHTLQPTALVHEAFLKLLGTASLCVESRGHFLAVAARTMRQILVDSLRRHRAVKRSGGAAMPTGTLHAALEAEHIDLLDLDEALDRLAAVDRRQAAIVELRFFGGLSIEETAKVLESSASTIKRQWKSARLWLFRELSADGPMHRGSP